MDQSASPSFASAPEPVDPSTLPQVLVLASSPPRLLERSKVSIKRDSAGHSIYKGPVITPRRTVAPLLPLCFSQFHNDNVATTTLDRTFRAL
ncbi:hypothetical protein NHJ13051_007948 [Beauveria bassiana]